LDNLKVVPVSRILPISEVKMKLTSLVTGLETGDEEVIIVRKGRPSAVLLSAKEYESLQETLEILADKDAMRAIGRSARYFRRRGRGLGVNEVFED
jgi:prevent-host-death family protein